MGPSSTSPPPRPTLASAHEYVHSAATVGIDALTGIHADAGDPGHAERASGRVPMGRPAQPEEIAPAVAWLIGSEAGYVTSAIVRVAGGL